MEHTVALVGAYTGLLLENYKGTYMMVLGKYQTHVNLQYHINHVTSI